MEIQTIVDRLNSPPFDKNYSLVAFDEKSPEELLELFLDVLGELDKTYKNITQTESKETLASKIVTFLQVLKYQVPIDGSSLDEFQAGIANGDKKTLYPILSYVLSRFTQLKKRAYVARYLLPIDVPPELSTDPVIVEMLMNYRNLQNTFKETHKSLEKITGGSEMKTSPAEYKREITQLESERSQLIDKIALLKEKTAKLKGFAPLLEATTALRIQQEEESKSLENLEEQRIALAAAERQYTEINRELVEIRASSREDLSAAELMQITRNEAEEAKNLLRHVLPASLEARRQTLARLQELMNRPMKSASDLQVLHSQIAVAEQMISQLTAQVTAAQRAAGDDKLAVFRQQSTLVTRKLAQKEEQLQLLLRDLDVVNREVETKEARLGELSGPKYMKKDEFKAYAAALRAKTARYKQLKAELSEARQETVILAHTENILKSKAGNLDKFLQRMEEKKGIAGYTAVQSDLEKVSALKARIDESKGQTLSDISRLVEDINRTIRDRKSHLAPVIKQLRQSRTSFAEFESNYIRVRAAYENVLVGIESEKESLERQADSMLSNLIAEESKRHVAQVQQEIYMSLLARAKEEAQYEQGEGRFLRDFPTLKSLFNHKLDQLQSQLDDLTNKKEKMLNDSTALARQRELFLSLKELLLQKIEAHKAYGRETAAVWAAEQNATENMLSIAENKGDDFDVDSNLLSFLS